MPCARVTRGNGRIYRLIVSDYENDAIRLPADVVMQIAEILGASTDELLGMKAQAARNDGGIKNRRLYRRMQEIEKLPRRDQEALLRTSRRLFPRPVEGEDHERTQ